METWRQPDQRSELRVTGTVRNLEGGAERTPLRLELEGRWFASSHPDQSFHESDLPGATFYSYKSRALLRGVYIGQKAKFFLILQY